MPPIKLEDPYESYVYCSPEQSAKSQKMSWSMTKPYSLTNKKSKYMCIQCKLKEAKWYCQKCVNYFCDECNQLIHYGNNVTENNLKSVFKHENFTKKIDFSTRPGKCSIHPDRDAEYFCEDCKRTICGYCRFKGAHNKGLQSQHLLEDIYESFKKVNQNQNQNAEGIDKKKTTAYKR